MRHGLLVVAGSAFVVCLCISVVYTIRLLVPREVAYLKSEACHEEEVKRYENKYLSETMTPWDEDDAKRKIDGWVKGSYIIELQAVQAINEGIVNRKKLLYRRAFLWAIAAIVPYMYCALSHITNERDKVNNIRMIDSKNN